MAGGLHGNTRKKERRREYNIRILDGTKPPKELCKDALEIIIADYDIREV